MSSFASTGWVLLAFAGFLPALHAQDATPARRIELPVPIGHEVKGLRVPVRTTEGKLDLQLDTETATRLDGQNVQMRTVAIQTYNQETSQPELKINLKTSVMNLDSNVIRSNEPIVVTRSDFQLTGDALEFNSKTREGTVTGNVRMLIFNRGELDKKPEKEGAEAAPATP